MTSLVAFSWCGTPQSQTIVVKVVMELSTKLTLSLTPSNMKMNVKQQRPQSAVFCQVNKQKRIYNFFIFSSLDQEKAVVKTEFQYKNCCNDRQGSFGKKFQNSWKYRSYQGICIFLGHGYLGESTSLKLSFFISLLLQSLSLSDLGNNSIFFSINKFRVGFFSYFFGYFCR